MNKEKVTCRCGSPSMGQGGRRRGRVLLVGDSTVCLLDDGVEEVVNYTRISKS